MTNPLDSGFGIANDRLARLRQALSAPDEAACQRCLNQLPDYVTTQLSGADYQAQFRDVAVHLDTCVECASVYARLYELELATMEGRLPQSSQTPTPDLSFLLPGSPGKVTPAVLRARLKATALAELVRSALRRAGDRLVLQLTPALLALAQPEPALAPVRAPGDAERYGKVLLWLEPPEPPRADMPIGLAAYLDARQTDTCLVEVTVAHPERSWPDLGGITVGLRWDGERREADTDAWGLAAFQNVPVSQLGYIAVEVRL